MILAIVGGKLQGIEALYLGHKAGYETVLVDNNPANPARKMCDAYIPMDVSRDREWPSAIAGVQLVLPALENEIALRHIREAAQNRGIPVAFDFESYNVTSSKFASNRLFRDLNLPCPPSWPQSNFPVIIKPDKGSGSKGVRLVKNQERLLEILCSDKNKSDWVVQEFIYGKSYSLEVIGTFHGYCTLQVTDIHLDADFDCKRVTAPTELEQNLVLELEQMAVRIADALNLHGVMDVEVIQDRGTLKLLEIDARLPSQTPATVFWSSGVNIVEQLAAVYTDSAEGHFANSIRGEESKSVVLEHIHVCGNRMEVAGEHIMVEGGPLSVHTSFFGASEAITDYPGKNGRWVATIINTGDQVSSAKARSKAVIERIMDFHGIDVFIDRDYKA
jgi:pyrrolysine biosynthesis protein PylC